MTTILSPVPKLQFFTAAGVPLAGGKLFTYTAGTSSPLATYTDSTGATANTNPIILDSRGEANVWLDDAAYKFKLTDSNNVEIWTVDNISSAQALADAVQANLTAYAASLAAPGGSSLVGFLQAGTGATARTVQTKLRETISVKDFGAVGNGIADDTAAVQAALVAAAGRSLYIPNGTYLCGALIVYSGTTIYGDDPTTSILKAQPTLGISTPLLRNQNTSGTAYVYTDKGIQVRNLGFNGNNLGNRLEGLVAFSKVEDGVFDNCRVFDIKYIGLVLAGCLSFAVNNSFFINCGNTVVTIEGGAAIWFGPAADTTISFDISVTENTFQSNNWSAIYANANRVSIIGNYMVGNKESAVYMTGSNNIVSNNWISNQTIKYISASGLEIAGDNVTITGNYIGDTDSDSISLTDINFVTVTGNTLLNPGRVSATFPTAACISLITLTASPNQPRYVTIVANNMWAPGNDAFAAITVGGVGGAPEHVLVSDNQMGSNSWNSGDSIYIAPGKLSTTMTIRDNPGYFDIFNYGGYAAGRFYAGETLSPAITTGTLALSANIMYVMPFAVRQQQTWTKLGCQVTTGSGGVFAYMGIYRMENGIPTKLVFDAGAVGLDSAGTKEITMSTPLLAGMYALVILPNSSGATIRAGTPSDAALSTIGTSAIGTADTLITAAQSYGTLPTTFPVLTRSSNSTPLLTLRYGV